MSASLELSNSTFLLMAASVLFHENVSFRVVKSWCYNCLGLIISRRGCLIYSVIFSLVLLVLLIKCGGPEITGPRHRPSKCFFPW